MVESARVRVPVGHPPAVFCTPGNRDLCERVVDHLSWTLGRVRFSTGGSGIYVRLEQSVANSDVFVVCSRDDLETEVNFMLFQLLFLIDALKAESPDRITVVLPCLEYSRQDRRFEAGESIAPKAILDMLVASGADRFVTIDLHNQAESGFCPQNAVLDELTPEKYFAHFIREAVPHFNPEETLVCATDAGGAKRARKMADELQVGFMMADKFRSKVGDVSQVKIIADATFNPKNVIIVDDMFDTCGSLVKVVEAVHAYVPDAKIFAVGTHGYFSKDAVDKIAPFVKDKTLTWIAVSNTVSQRNTKKKFEEAGVAHSLKVVDMSRLLAGAIIRVHLGASLNLPKFRQLGPGIADPVLAEAAFVPTSQYALLATSVS